MSPGYLVFPSRVVEILTGKTIVDNLQGSVLSIEPYQLTLRLSREAVKLINVKDEIKEK